MNGTMNQERIAWLDIGPVSIKWGGVQQATPVERGWELAVVEMYAGCCGRLPKFSHLLVKAV
jgi:hypothetical protein